MPSPLAQIQTEESPPALDLLVRCGCEFVFECAAPTPILLALAVQDRPGQRVADQRVTFTPAAELADYRDFLGNTIHVHRLAPGTNQLRYDTLVRVSSRPENAGPWGRQLKVEELPSQLLRYTMPSRYCDSDRLLAFAQAQFAHLPPGQPLVQGILDWIHTQIEYRAGSGSPLTSASEIVAQRYGVCRDFAHVLIALCRCFNLPARYVTGYVPDIGVHDPGTPMDFHAYAQVWLGDRWHTVDARFNTPRIGRIHIAQGLDAVDGAFATHFGPAQLTGFQVWSYQISEHDADLDRPVNPALDRLCGSPEVRPSRDGGWDAAPFESVAWGPRPVATAC